MRHSWLVVLVMCLAVPALSMTVSAADEAELLRRPLDLPAGGLTKRDREEEDAPESILFWGGEFEGDQFVIVFPAYGFCGDTTVFAAIKAEVTAAVNQLSPESKFDLIGFNSQVFTWRPMVVPANAANTGAAISWMSTMVPIESHCLVEAVTTGLGISQMGDSDAKQMLVCGARTPYCNGQGGDSYVQQALMTITSSNYEMTPMHTIYFTTNFYSGEQSFYQQLAAMNGGTFRQVSF